MCRINRRQFLQSLAAGAAFVSMSDMPKTEYKRDNSEEKKMDLKTYVAYCGTYCNLCSERIRIPVHSKALMESLEKADYAGRAPTEFWSYLKSLTVVEDDKCCRTGKCGAPSCAMKKCAIEKGIYVCPECEDYPCVEVKTLGKSEPTLIHDGMRIREIGLDAWVIEQEGRKHAGFCYEDVRCSSCEVPTD